MRRTVAVVVIVLVAAAVGATAALARHQSTAARTAVVPATTGLPGTYAIINVKLGDKVLKVSRHRSKGVQVIGFRIRNIGKKQHNFIIGDWKTNPIAPGQFDDFAVNFDDYGKYLYRCTLNCPKTARGYINVQRGTKAPGYNG